MRWVIAPKFFSGGHPVPRPPFWKKAKPENRFAVGGGQGKVFPGGGVGTKPPQFEAIALTGCGPGLRANSRDAVQCGSVSASSQGWFGVQAVRDECGIGAVRAQIGPVLVGACSMT